MLRHLPSITLTFSLLILVGCGADERREAPSVALATSHPGNATPSAPASAAPAPSAPARSPGCAGEVNYPCPQGFEDGCVGGRTTEHVCVRVDAPATLPCDQPASLTCETGTLDACAATPPYGQRHICVQPVPNRAALAAPATIDPWALRNDCRNEIVYHCGAGLEDGCIGDRTTSHVCVRKGAAATVPCDKPASLTCTDGMVDACTTTPPFGGFHICVKPYNA